MMGIVESEALAGRGRAGPTVVNLYSVDQAAAFLRADDLEALKDPVSGASYGYIDLAALIWWLTNVFGDTELAQAIDADAGEFQHCLGQIELMRELLVKRLEQCDSAVSAIAEAG